MKLKTKILLYILGGLLFTNLIIVEKILEENPSNLTPVKNSFSVNFLDIGQGDSILIQTPNNKQILIDGGPNYTNLKEKLEKIMPSNDKQIDIVLLTHADFDHLGGLVSLLDNYEVDLVITNPSDKETKTFQEWKNKLNSYNISTKKGLAGERISFKDNNTNIFEMDLIYPYNIETLNNADDENEKSIVAKLSFQNKSFLLTGDAGHETEDSLAKIYKDDYLNINVLKAGHHGSKNSTSKDFVSFLSPEYSIISVGNNNYGHPNQEVLNNLKDTNIIRTDLYGTISFILNNDNHFEIKCEKECNF